MSNPESQVVDDLVRQTRTCVQELISSQDQFDSRDIDRVKSEDHFLRRYLQDEIEDRGHVNTLTQLKPKDAKDMVEAAASNVIKTMKWRKEFNVGNLSGNNIPKEFFTKQFIVIDKVNKMLIFRGKLYFTVNEWMDVYHDITRYVLESFDRSCGRGTLHSPGLQRILRELNEDAFAANLDGGKPAHLGCRQRLHARISAVAFRH